MVLLIRMKITTPNYFNDFTCMANHCPDTCCKDWEIVIDSETQKLYQELLEHSHPFGKILQKHLYQEGEDTLVRLRQDKSCPFLNKTHLCEIQKQIGESYLCTTCRLFPRYENEYGNLCEMGLSFSCPAAGKIMLSQQQAPRLLTYKMDGRSKQKIDRSLLTQLLNFRDILFDVIWNPNDSLSQKNDKIYRFTLYVQECIETKKAFSQNDIYRSLSNQSVSFSERKITGFVKRHLRLEPMYKEWHEMLNNALKTPRLSFNTAFSHEYQVWMTYFLYRHMLKAVYDNELLLRVKMAIASWYVIQRLLQTECNHRQTESLPQDTIESIFRLYSKEIEHLEPEMYLVPKIIFK